MLKNLAVGSFLLGAVIVGVAAAYYFVDQRKCAPEGAVETIDFKEENWWAARDSNPGPPD